MFFTKILLPSFLVVATTSCVGSIDIPATSKHIRKLSKKTAKGGGGSTSIFATNIEGTYVYTNKCGMLRQLTIDCGGFPADPDLCEITDFSIGTLTAETDPVCVALDNGANYTPTLVEGETIDPDKTCVFSGVFRKPSGMDRTEKYLKPVPLATSNGCSTTTADFQTVVEAEVQAADSSLEISFSDDKGGSWYTNNKACSKLYIGHKVDYELLHRALLAISDGESVVDTRHRHLIAIPHSAIPTGAAFTTLDYPSRALIVYDRLTINNQTPFHAKAYATYEQSCRNDYWGWNACDDEPAVPPGKSAQHGAYRGWCRLKRVYANLKDVPPNYELDGHIIPADALNHNGELECDTLYTMCKWAGSKVQIEIKPEGYTNYYGNIKYCRVIDPKSGKNMDICKKKGEISVFEPFSF